MHFAQSIKDSAYLFHGLGALLLVLGMSSCRISYFDSPDQADPGSVIQIHIQINDDITPENTVADGVLALLLPNDWLIQDAHWTSSFGGGSLLVSEVWHERVLTQYPLHRFDPGMSWFAFRTDSAFAYQTDQVFYADLTVQVSDSLALYKLGCVATRATHGGNGLWTKVSYPHFLGIPSLSDYESYRVEAADEWTSLFTRQSGWTGGDGTYSIPLDGDERYSMDASRQTLFHFSDTFIGEVNDAGVRQGGTYLINNSQAHLTGSQPIEENISFNWGATSTETWIVPETPWSEDGNWFWQMDGISLSDSIHIFELRMRSDSQVGFAIEGVVLASGIIDSAYQISNLHQKDMAVEYTNPGNNSQIAFGQAVMPQTVRSGCPDPDGFIYIYGPRSYSGGKALVAARVGEDSLSYDQAWQFWDGESWSPDIEDCADITTGISQEHSVSQAANGEYILTYMLGGLSGPVCISRSPTPVGPFSHPEVVWTPQETNISSNVFTYNAKAHPHLSAPGELLMSYEVNTFSFSEHFSNADVYHPRFVRLRYDNYVSTKPTLTQAVQPENFNLRAFPNPFNGQVTLSWGAQHSSIDQLRIYDLTGRFVRNWDAAELSAKHQMIWDGRNFKDELVPTGIYLVHTGSYENEYHGMTKITLLK